MQLVQLLSVVMRAEICVRLRAWFNTIYSARSFVQFNFMHLCICHQAPSAICGVQFGAAYGDCIEWCLIICVYSQIHAFGSSSFFFFFGLVYPRLGVLDIFELNEPCNCGFELPSSLRCLSTYLLIPWSRVLVEKLTGFQLVKKFPAFCGTRRFITAVTSARLLSVSWASSIQSTPLRTKKILFPIDDFRVLHRKNYNPLCSYCAPIVPPNLLPTH